jgi:hypothetical protein
MRYAANDRDNPLECRDDEDKCADEHSKFEEAPDSGIQLVNHSFPRFKHE